MSETLSDPIPQWSSNLKRQMEVGCSYVSYLQTCSNPSASDSMVHATMPGSLYVMLKAYILFALACFENFLPVCRNSSLASLRPSQYPSSWVLSSRHPIYKFVPTIAAICSLLPTELHAWSGDSSVLLGTHLFHE